MREFLRENLVKFLKAKDLYLTEYSKLSPMQKVYIFLEIIMVTSCIAHQVRVIWEEFVLRIPVLPCEDSFSLIRLQQKGHFFVYLLLVHGTVLLLPFLHLFPLDSQKREMNSSYQNKVFQNSKTKDYFTELVPRLNWSLN